MREEFSPSEDGQEGLLGILQSHGEVVELFLHQEACCLLRKIHSHHGAGGGGGGDDEGKAHVSPDTITPTLLTSSVIHRRIQTSSSPVGSVGRAKGVVDVNISQLGQRRPEGVDLLLGGFGLRKRRQETGEQRNNRRSL